MFVRRSIVFLSVCLSVCLLATCYVKNCKWKWKWKFYRTCIFGHGIPTRFWKSSKFAFESKWQDSPWRRSQFSECSCCFCCYYWYFSLLLRPTSTKQGVNIEVKQTYMAATEFSIIITVVIIVIVITIITIIISTTSAAILLVPRYHHLHTSIWLKCLTFFLTWSHNFSHHLHVIQFVSGSCADINIASCYWRSSPPRLSQDGSVRRALHLLQNYTAAACEAALSCEQRRNVNERRSYWLSSAASLIGLHCE